MEQRPLRGALCAVRPVLILANGDPINIGWNVIKAVNERMMLVSSTRNHLTTADCRCHHAGVAKTR